MILKYNIKINNNIILKRFSILINQIYKLLPIREEGGDWEKNLNNILEELAGIQRILNQDCVSELFFLLIVKLEGLYYLNKTQDFACYRKTIFECLNLMSKIREELCLQNC